MSFVQVPSLFTMALNAQHCASLETSSKAHPAATSGTGMIDPSPATLRSFEPMPATPLTQTRTTVQNGASKPSKIICLVFGAVFGLAVFGLVIFDLALVRPSGRQRSGNESRSRSGVIRGARGGGFAGAAALRDQTNLKGSSNQRQTFHVERFIEQLERK